jgi:hypothetical protein
MNLNHAGSMIAGKPHMEQNQQKPNRSNLRTGLILASIALVFFLSVIVRRLMLAS